MGSAGATYARSTAAPCRGSFRGEGRSWAHRAGTPSTRKAASRRCSRRRARTSIEGVVAIGGDGTLGIAHRLHTEHGYPRGRRPEDDRQRPRRHGRHDRVRHGRPHLHRGDRPHPHDGRVAQPRDDPRGDGPEHGLDRGRNAASREAPTSSSFRSGRRPSRTSATSSGAGMTRAATSPSSLSPRGTR